jgi:hypothetical protein
VDRTRPDGAPRVFVTPNTALYVPGRDHAPETDPVAVRVFSGSVWLAAAQLQLYRERGTALPASDTVLFDAEPGTLAERLRASAPSTG